MTATLVVAPTLSGVPGFGSPWVRGNTQGIAAQTDLSISSGSGGGAKAAEEKFKEAAGRLGDMAFDAQNMLARPASAFAPVSERPLQHVDRIEVWNSFNLVLRRLAEKLVVGEIHAEQVTVADQMEYLLAHFPRSSPLHARLKAHAMQ